MRARNSGGARTGAPGPRQRGAVGLSRIGRREHERVVVGAGPELAQALDSAGERELGSAEAFDEVAPATGADRLEGAQLAVDGPVATRDALTANAVSHDDSLALQQELRERTTVDGRREQPGRQRPATLRRGRLCRPRAREPARPPIGDRRAVASSRAQRRPGVVRHLAGPHELPEGGQRRLGVETGRREQVGPELGRAREGARAAPAAASPSGGGAPAGAPRSGASARKYSATRSRPAPTQTTSPVAQSASSQAGW